MTNEELKPNMYIRTNDGYINKIKKANQYNALVDARDLFGEELNIPNNEIIKASHNIIDLIEVGDYVNGLKVIEVREHLHNDIEVVLSNGKFQWSFSKNESDYEIKSIVTKEQFEEMQYVVK